MHSVNDCGLVLPPLAGALNWRAPEASACCILVWLTRRSHHDAGVPMLYTAIWTPGQEHALTHFQAVCPILSRKACTTSGTEVNSRRTAAAPLSAGVQTSTLA